MVSVGCAYSDIAGNSNIYLAELENPWTIKKAVVRLSKPEYDWGVGFWVNEGPAVVVHGDKLFYQLFGQRHR